MASEVDIPVPGTNSSVGISAVSSAFIGYDYYNNLQNENAGRAFMHTAATTTSTAVGVDMLIQESYILVQEVVCSHQLQWN